MFSVLEIGLKSARADDDLNTLGAGALAGAIYRSPYGSRAAGVGAAMGLLLATTWVLVNPDSRGRIREMVNFA
uniref:Complex I-B14.7 n=2 Tax=Bursaphelenchus xylophilus TaxID=6326 RepID=A0A1I7RL85_BURXY